MDTIRFTPKVSFDKRDNQLRIADQLMCLHCHHYNAHLLRTAEDPDYIDGPRILAGAAENVVAQQLANHLRDFPDIRSSAQRLSVAADMFRMYGFVILDFSKADEKGGTVTSPSSHIALGWKVKWGPRETPCCHFNRGFIAGAFATIYGKSPGYFKVVETQCIAVGAESCVYKVEVNSNGNK
ncbi:MAG: hypothetical protein HYU64_03445 [Armatimonadetes bacterium]|nr:hypothetical protein [Armatimonadota bacterium]